MHHAATQCRKSRLEMGDLQLQANPCNARPITRKEMRSAVRVRSSALFFVAICRTNQGGKKTLVLSRLPVDTTHTRRLLVSRAAVTGWTYSKWSGTPCGPARVQAEHSRRCKCPPGWPSVHYVFTTSICRWLYQDVEARKANVSPRGLTRRLH